MRKGIFTVSLIILTTLFLCNCSEDIENKSKADITESTASTTPISSLNDEVADGKIKNTSRLNFDDTIIQIPEVEKMYSLKLTVSRYSMDELIPLFIDCASNFSEKEVNKDDLLFDYLTDGTQTTTYKYSSDLKVDDNFYKISYTDDVSSVAYQGISSFFTVDIGNNDVMDSITQLSEKYFSTENNDEIIELADYAYNFASDNLGIFLKSDFFEIKPYSYQEEDSEYLIKYNAFYKDVPFNTNYYSTYDENGESKDSGEASNYVSVFVNKDKEITKISSFYHFNVEETGEYTELIPFEKACDIVDKNISDDVTFDVTRVDLLYNMKEEPVADSWIYDYESTPYWKFTINDTNIPQYPKLAFLVNAVTGELYTYNINI